MNSISAATSLASSPPPPSPSPSSSSSMRVYAPHQYDSSVSTRNTVAALVFLGWVVLIVLARVIRELCSRLPGRDPAAELGSRGATIADDAPSRPARDAAGAAEVEVELKKKAGPVVAVCVYRGADGWREATCPVCLADFADGEAVSVLPACMHCFHAACIGEWLRARATCPLCRAAPDAAAAMA